jgi:hypothetical protein
MAGFAPSNLDLRNPAFVALSRSLESGNSPSILAPMGWKSSHPIAPDGGVEDAHIPAGTLHGYNPCSDNQGISPEGSRLVQAD